MVWRVAAAAHPFARAVQGEKSGIPSRESRSHQVGRSRGIADLDPQTFANFKRAWRADHGSYHMLTG
jgi:hypothetical protein